MGQVANSGSGRTRKAQAQPMVLCLRLSCSPWKRRVWVVRFPLTCHRSRMPNRNASDSRGLMRLPRVHPRHSICTGAGVWRLFQVGLTIWFCRRRGWKACDCRLRMSACSAFSSGCSRENCVAAAQVDRRFFCEPMADGLFWHGNLVHRLAMWK